MVKKLTMFLAALLLTAVGAMAQTQVKGTVVSQEDGLPIVGAAVQIVGTSQGTVTNGNGEFQLTVPSSGATLRISYLGMQTINVTAARTMRIEMLSDNKILNEVVVTALGISREQKTLGYSAQTIDNAQLTEGKVTDVTSALAGKVAGVQINATSGDPGQANSVIIRGISSINGNNQPLYVIDGVPLQSTTLLAQQHQNAIGGITNVNPNDIENMTVLKGAAATALYGSRAANGVILITTKSGAKNGRQTFIENGSWGPEMDGSDQVYGPIWNGQQLIHKYEAAENNIKDFFDTGVSTNHSVALSGVSSDSKMTYYLSYSYLSWQLSGYRLVQTLLECELHKEQHQHRGSVSGYLDDRWYS